MSGHPRSTHPATKGSSVRSSRVSINKCHAVGLTKTRSWRRGFSLARLDGELMNALLNVSGFGATASLLTEHIAPITALATLVQQRLQLLGKRAPLLPRGQHRPGQRQVLEAAREHLRVPWLFLEQLDRQFVHAR